MTQKWISKKTPQWKVQFQKKVRGHVPSPSSRGWGEWGGVFLRASTQSFYKNISKLFTHERESWIINHTPLKFNNNANVKQTGFKKYLSLILDSQVRFEEHLKTIFSKANKTIGLIRKLKNSLSRRFLLTLCKSFIRPHFDIGDIARVHPFNNSFQNKIESIPYSACLTIPCAIRGTSKERLYEELDLESLQHRRWYRKLCYLYKIVVNISPNYLFKVIPTSNTIYKTRNTNDIPLMKG